MIKTLVIALVIITGVLAAVNGLIGTGENTGKYIFFGGLTFLAETILALFYIKKYSAITEQTDTEEQAEKID